MNKLDQNLKVVDTIYFRRKTVTCQSYLYVHKIDILKRKTIVVHGQRTSGYVDFMYYNAQVFQEESGIDLTDYFIENSHKFEIDKIEKITVHDFKEKEYRVYVLYANYERFQINTSTEISDWNEQEILPERAKEFIELVEEHGNVYSLTDFQNALNENILNIYTNWIFITNKYD